jgi:Major Facilitator Superfamily
MDRENAQVVPTARLWWIHRDFAYLWVGQSLSNIGDALLSTSFVFIVVTSIAPHQPWAPLAVSGLLMTQIVPSLLLRPLAGVWVDRWNTRRTMMVVDGLRALAILGYWQASAFLLHAAWPWRLGVVYGLVLVVSLGTQFFNPAQMVLLADIVPAATRGRASGLSLITSQFALVIGPALAAPAYFVFGIQSVLAADLVSFLISCCTIWAISASRGNSTPPRDVQHFWQDFRAGLHLFATQPILRTVAISLAVAMVGIGVLESLNVFFVTLNLQAPVAWFGYLGAAFSAGSILGGAVGMVWVARVGLIRAYTGSMCAVGIMLMLYAWMDRFWLALCIFALLGIPNAVNNVAVGPLILNVTPFSFVGRIFAILTPAWSGVFFLSIFVSGVLFSSIASQGALLLFGRSIHPLTWLLMLSGMLVLTGGIYAQVTLKLTAKEQSDA